MSTNPTTALPVPPITVSVGNRDSPAKREMLLRFEEGTVPAGLPKMQCFGEQWVVRVPVVDSEICPPDDLYHHFTLPQAITYLQSDLQSLHTRPNPNLANTASGG